jgi:hypothetical protein
MPIEPTAADEIASLLGRPELAAQTLQRRCFVASSFRNQELVHRVVDDLRRGGWFVYDFTAAELSLSETDWGGLSYAEAREHPDVSSAATSDITMLRCLGAADVMLVILPAGFSAGWEAGYASARGARVVVCGDLHQMDVPVLHATYIASSIDDALAHIRGLALAPEPSAPTRRGQRRYARRIGAG